MEELKISVANMQDQRDYFKKELSDALDWLDDSVVTKKYAPLDFNHPEADCRIIETKCFIAVYIVDGLGLATVEKLKGKRYVDSKDHIYDPFTADTDKPFETGYNFYKIQPVDVEQYGKNYFMKKFMGLYDDYLNFLKFKMNNLDLSDPVNVIDCGIQTLKKLKSKLEDSEGSDK